MIPYLHKEDSVDFTHLGLGSLKDAISCFVTQELNGLYYLTMEYPVSGRLAEEIRHERIIVADAGEEFLYPDSRFTKQRFIITRIEVVDSKIMTVHAEHAVQFKIKNMSLKPRVVFSGTAQDALNSWNAGMVKDIALDVVVDRPQDFTETKSGVWKIEDVPHALAALGGTEHSILELYGGEFLFETPYEERARIRLMKRRGIEREQYIAHGYNLRNSLETLDIEDTVTGIVPYLTYRKENAAEGEDPNKRVDLPYPYVMEIPQQGFHHHKIISVDLSGEDGDGKPLTTQAQLRAKATRLVNSFRGIYLINMNAKVGYVDMDDSLGLDLAESPVRSFALGDTIHLHTKGLYKHPVRDRITKVVYNTLMDRNESIEIGSPITTMADSIMQLANKERSGKGGGISTGGSSSGGGDYDDVINTIVVQLENKVDKIPGKGLSTNDFTNTDKTRVNSVPNKVDKVTGKGLSTNDYTTLDKDRVNEIPGIVNTLPNKVDVVAGKGLSTNDYTTTEKNKLSGIAAGADVTPSDVSTRSVSRGSGSVWSSTTSPRQLNYWIHDFHERTLELRNDKEPRILLNIRSLSVPAATHAYGVYSSTVTFTNPYGIIPQVLTITKMSRLGSGIQTQIFTLNENTIEINFSRYSTFGAHTQKVALHFYGSGGAAIP